MNGRRPESSGLKRILPYAMGGTFCGSEAVAPCSMPGYGLTVAKSDHLVVKAAESMDRRISHSCSVPAQA